MTQATNLPSRLALPLLILLLPLAATFGIYLMAGEEGLFSESGPIERLSAAFLMLAAVWLGLWGDLSRWHQVALILAAALRELDWDKAFTERGVLSLGLYTGDHPAGQKLAGAAVLTLLIWAGVRLLRRNLGPWLAGLRQRSVAAWAMLAAILLYAVAKSLDGLGRKLVPLGIEISVQANALAGRSEEVLELFGAILILQIVMAGRH